MNRVPPDPWRADAEYAAALLAAMVRAIDRRSEGDHQELLTEFLATAWPSFRAQDQ